MNTEQSPFAKQTSIFSPSFRSKMSRLGDLTAVLKVMLPVASQWSYSCGPCFGCDGPKDGSYGVREEKKKLT